MYEAELLAILHALRISEEMDLHYVCIVSDSRSAFSALDSFDNKRNHHYLIYMIKDCLLSLKNRGFIFHFIWIPGHKNIFGNEVADRLAKVATSIAEVHKVTIQSLHQDSHSGECFLQ